MDEPDFSSTPYLSSSLDDTFYIVKKTLHRVVSTASVSNLVGMCKEMRIVLERDVAEVWKARIEGAFKDLAANAQSQSAIGGMAVTGMAGMAQLGGRAREEERETRERDARNVYIVRCSPLPFPMWPEQSVDHPTQVYLNNLDTAASYTSRLLAELSASDALGSAFFLFTELDRARTSFALLRSSEDKFRAVLKSGLDHLFNQLVRPKLRPLLSDVYKDVSYKLDDDAYNEAEYRDDVRKRFVKAWDALLSGYKVRLCSTLSPSRLTDRADRHTSTRAQDSLTEGNFNLFFSTAVNVLVRPWESMIRGMKFTEVRPPRLVPFLRARAHRSVVTAAARRAPTRPRHPDHPLVPLVAGFVRVGFAARVVLAAAADRDATDARQPGRGRGGADCEREPIDDG